MAYYTALAVAWSAGTVPSGVTGNALTGLSTANKLAAINAWTVPGPNMDVGAGQVLGYLALQGKWTPLQTYASTGTGQATAILAAKELVALLSSPAFSTFQMSISAVYMAVAGFLAALAADSGSGILTADVNALLSLAATTTLWWSSIGLTSPISSSDLAAAGGLS